MICTKCKHEHNELTKTCKRCKELDRNYRIRNYDKVKLREANYREQNRAKLIQRSKEWNKNNPEKVKASRKKSYLKFRQRVEQLGLTERQYRLKKKTGEIRSRQTQAEKLKKIKDLYDRWNAQRWNSINQGRTNS